MAVIKVEINGKANTKPIKDTEAAAQGMFKKIEGIDNKLKSFVGFKIFSEVSKTVIYHRHSRWLEEAPLKGAFSLYPVHPDSTDRVDLYQDLPDS